MDKGSEMTTTPNHGHTMDAQPIAAGQTIDTTYGQAMDTTDTHHHGHGRVGLYTHPVPCPPLRGDISDSQKPQPIASTRQDSTINQPPAPPRTQGETDASEGVEPMTTNTTNEATTCQRNPDRDAVSHDVRTRNRARYTPHHDHATHAPKPTATEARRRNADTPPSTDESEPRCSPTVPSAIGDADAQQQPPTTSRRYQCSMTGRCGLAYSCQRVPGATSGCSVRTDAGRPPCFFLIVRWRTPVPTPNPNDFAPPNENGFPAVRGPK